MGGKSRKTDRLRLGSVGLLLRFAVGQVLASRPLRRDVPEPGLLRSVRRANLRSVKPKTELPQEPQQPITLRVNTLIKGKFIQAGEPLPGSSDELPEILQPFIVSGDDDQPEEAEGVVRANYEIGATYLVDENGRMGRALSRQIARLEAENALQDFAEEQLSEPLAPAIADALQDQNDAHVARQIAEAQAAAKRADMADEAAVSESEEDYDIPT